MSKKQLNKEIIPVYSGLREELIKKAPQLLGDNCSNIFCIGVPGNWESASIRVMIVGEEGFWGKKDKEKYENFEVCQKWVVDELCKQINENGNEEKNTGCFWNRFRSIVRGLPPGGAFCWANIDSICNVNTVNGALTTAERKQLHTTDVQVLRQVSNIIRPTHIIFFGWHNRSLKHEFPELYDCVCPNGKYSASFFQGHGAILDCYFDGIKCIFTYHPRYAICLKRTANQYVGESDYRKEIIKRILKS